MKVYITIAMNGWEMCGIDKVFSSREKAEQYLISEPASAPMKKHKKQVRENNRKQKTNPKTMLIGRGDGVSDAVQKGWQAYGVHMSWKVAWAYFD